MNIQTKPLDKQALRESVQVAIAPTILPATIEHTARKVFESFSNRFKKKLNGRQERALKLALEGHVTHKSDRIFSVRSEKAMSASTALLLILSSRQTKRTILCPGEMEDLHH